MKIIKINGQSGLTLIEMIMTIAIMTLLLGAISYFLIKSFYLNRYVLEQGVNSSVLQNSLRHFSTRLREARHSEDGSYLLEDCQEYQIIFYADTDNDGFSERLTYSMENQQLKLTTTEPDLSQDPPDYSTGTETERIIGNGVINEDISEPIFYYYEEDAELPISGTVDPDQVQLVRFRVFADTDTTKDPGPVLIETLVRPRNIP